MTTATLTETVTTTPFRCVGCRTPLLLAEGRCRTCGWEGASESDVLNFVTNPALRAEAEHYDHEYAGNGIPAPAEPQVLGQLWRGNAYAPFNELILDALGDLTGRRVLALGNGTGVKELHLLTQNPEALIISDLSANAMRRMRAHFETTTGPDAAWWAAIDGLDLPFADGSLDIVYGYAFVHHLPDLEQFLAEVTRVLAPGGRAVFFDAAYSPLWQSAKRRWLNPLMRVAHRVNPISDEDVRATMQGGYRREDVEALVRTLGAVPLYQPWGFFHYLFARAGQIFASGGDPLRLGPPRWDGATLRVKWSRTLRGLAAVDRALSARSQRFRENQLRLIWGLEKPHRD